MSLKGIVHITGMSGLYKVLANTRGNFIVESLGLDKKRIPVSSTARVASLSEISIYTYEAQVELAEVLKTMKTSGLELPDTKANNDTFFAYFRQILPDFDEEKVYASDIKKLVKWFDLLDKAIDLSVIDLDGNKNEDPKAE